MKQAARSCSILYALSKQAKVLGANKLAKQLLDRIQTLRVPQRFQEQVEVATLVAKAKPFSDPEELLPMCYRCSTYNPLNGTSNFCVNCGQKFVFSFVSFEILPLVEFQLEEGISDMEAVRLIESSPRPETERGGGDGWIQEVTETHQTLHFDSDADTLSDAFTARLEGSGEYIPVTVNRNILQQMDSSTILICKWSPPLRYQYYRNLLPELQITICYTCFKAFHVDDFELQVLQKGHCPFCRTPPDVNGNLDLSDDQIPDV